VFVFLFFIFCFLLIVFLFVLFCVQFLPMCIVAYFLFVYNFTYNCHRVENELHLINIIPYSECLFVFLY